MAYVLAHTMLAFDLWALIALIVLIVVIVFFVVNHRKLKKQEKELKEELSSKYSDDAVADGPAV